MKQVIRIVGLTALIIMMGCVQSDKTRLTICCAGDSLMRPIPYHLENILKDSKGKIIIKDWSRGGLSSKSYRAFFLKRWKGWRKTRPDFVLIQLGTNDVTPLLQQEYDLENFRVNLKAIIEKFKTFRGRRYKTPKIFIASVPLFCQESRGKGKNQLVAEKINPGIREIASEENIIFVDNFSLLFHRAHLYSPDGVHPNAKGERVLAKNWLFWLRSELRKGY